ncbi:hypothetical protein ACFFX0_13755 [Citricoccus parietis]|uniref:Uncharacterized protein n=1 Tax=Citricoccus parietis TaxID=592307 RepID=A0ABV5FZU6_9MICC
MPPGGARVIGGPGCRPAGRGPHPGHRLGPGGYRDHGVRAGGRCDDAGRPVHRAVPAAPAGAGLDGPGLRAGRPGERAAGLRTTHRAPPHRGRMGTGQRTEWRTDRGPVPDGVCLGPRPPRC